MHSLDRITGEDTSHDPRFVILLFAGQESVCHKQVVQMVFEDLLEDLDDGTLCARSLRSDRNFDSLPALPSKEEFAWLTQDKSKLPKRGRSSHLKVCDNYFDLSLE